MRHRRIINIQTQPGILHNTLLTIMTVLELSPTHQFVHKNQWTLEMLIPHYKLWPGLENLVMSHKNWYPLFVYTWKLHLCTTQKHQVLDHRWPGLLLQTTFYQCCQAMRVHFMALEDINRIKWGTRLLLTAVLAPFGDYISLCHILKARHCLLSPNGCFSSCTALHPPTPHPLLYAHPYRPNPWYYRSWKTTSSIQVTCRNSYEMMAT